MENLKKTARMQYKE